MNEREARELEERLRGLRAGAVPVDVRDERRRQEGVRGIERAILTEASRKQRVRRVVRASFIAAAAAVLMGVGVTSWKLGRDAGERTAQGTEAAGLQVRKSSGSVVVQQSRGTRLLDPSQKSDLVAGDRIETLVDGSAEISNEHTVWKLDRTTRLELVGAGPTGERMKLAHGRVHVDVRHVKERNVVVETPHVEVLVVGTAFSVTVDGEGAALRTRVDVARGTVWILHDGERRAVLQAGQGWSSAPPQPVAVPAPEREVVSPPAASAAAPSASTEAGTLAEENRLFRSALDARNRGDNARAAELFAELLRRFPRSVVAEEASVGRLRALSALGRRHEAEAEARRYLARFPSGHARAEAERVLDSKPSR